jgi:hypothetical protein
MKKFLLMVYSSSIISGGLTVKQHSGFGMITLAASMGYEARLNLCRVEAMIAAK